MHNNNMSKILIASLFTLLNMSSALSGQGQFVFNYKNINSIVATLCHVSTPKDMPSTIYTSKISIDKTVYGTQQKQVRFDITGICNAQFGSKSNKLKSFGEVLSLTLDLNKLPAHEGTIGLNKFKLIFTDNNIKAIELSDFLTGKRSIINLESSQWAQSNAVIALDRKHKIKINSNKTKAVEFNSILAFGKSDLYFGIWSYNSFGCAGPKQISRKNCEKLLEQLDS